MNSAFNAADTAAIIARLEKLSPSAQRRWGKMDISQMLAHCNASLETAMGLDNPQPLPFLMRLMGKLFKKSHFSEKPFPKNSPTDKSYVIAGARDFEVEKAKVIRQLRAFSAAGPAGCPARKHVFFGMLQPEEWAIMQWKHFDHHLRQFGG